MPPLVQPQLPPSGLLPALGKLPLLDHLGNEALHRTDFQSGCEDAQSLGQSLEHCESVKSVSYRHHDCSPAPLPHVVHLTHGSHSLSQHAFP